eukprot:gnl/MRDRNA2_/MRDRNA2_110038_c0_seq1.p1 gnl/MRDRNA2_/MRDRNA2_110038_c0~~gnl/MRDRNA2_/MRDRNA2_110038_c0_seq1.p1  ORF type:complete len:567 (+),score=147.06 gnl/MRDRNA2_/MRDRNA2_110038_c0_seq1:188-1888(+)
MMINEGGKEMSPLKRALAMQRCRELQAHLQQEDKPASADVNVWCPESLTSASTSSPAVTPSSRDFHTCRISDENALQLTTSSPMASPTSHEFHTSRISGKAEMLRRHVADTTNQSSQLSPTQGSCAFQSCRVTEQATGSSATVSTTIIGEGSYAFQSRQLTEQATGSSATVPTTIIGSGIWESMADISMADISMTDDKFQSAVALFPATECPNGDHSGTFAISDSMQERLIQLTELNEEQQEQLAQQQLLIVALNEKQERSASTEMAMKLRSIRLESQVNTFEEQIRDLEKQNQQAQQENRSAEDHARRLEQGNRALEVSDQKSCQEQAAYISALAEQYEVSTREKDVAQELRQEMLEDVELQQVLVSELAEQREATAKEKNIAQIFARSEHHHFSRVQALQSEVMEHEVSQKIWDGPQKSECHSILEMALEEKSTELAALRDRAFQDLEEAAEINADRQEALEFHNAEIEALRDRACRDLQRAAHFNALLEESLRNAFSEIAELQEQRNEAREEVQLESQHMPLSRKNALEMRLKAAGFHVPQLDAQGVGSKIVDEKIVKAVDAG